MERSLLYSIPYKNPLLRESHFPGFSLDGKCESFSFLAMDGSPEQEGGPLWHDLCVSHTGEGIETEHIKKGSEMQHQKPPNMNAQAASGLDRLQQSSLGSFTQLSFPDIITRRNWKDAARRDRGRPKSLPISMSFGLTVPERLRMI